MVSRNRLKAYAAIVAVFALGAVAGAASAYALTQHQYEQLMAGDREAFEKQRIQALARELELTRDQQTRTREVFRKHRDERQQLMRNMHEQCGEPLRNHLAKIDAEIRSFLNPEQQRKYDLLVKEQRARRFGLAKGQTVER